MSGIAPLLTGLLGIVSAFSGNKKQDQQIAANLQAQKLQAATSSNNSARAAQQQAADTASQLPVQSANLETQAMQSNLAAFRDALLKPSSGRY